MLSLDLAREIMAFMKTRTEARENYHAALDGLEKFRGSRYYTEQA